MNLNAEAYRKALYPPLPFAEDPPHVSDEEIARALDRSQKRRKKAQKMSNSAQSVSKMLPESRKYQRNVSTRAEGEEK